MNRVRTFEDARRNTHNIEMMVSERELDKLSVTDDDVQRILSYYVYTLEHTLADVRLALKEPMRDSALLADHYNRVTELQAIIFLLGKNAAFKRTDTTSVMRAAKRLSERFNLV